MKRYKLVIGVLAVLSAAFAIYYVLNHEKTLLTHPKGIIAQSELSVIITSYLLMLIIILPTFVLLFVVAWKYHAKNKKAKYDPEQKPRAFKEVILWIIPSSVIAVMAVITWDVAHKLDPYRPLVSDIRPLTIQVVALDWKWLFIYPEQGIATVNLIQFPEKVPIHFDLAADGSPMNSFWVPQLSGQIYAMTGMITQLNIMADEIGEYAGRAAEINGRGYADMTFVVKSTSQSDFEEWVAKVKKSPLKLTSSVYNEMIKPSEKNPIALYSDVDDGLFNDLVMKYMHPTTH